MKKINITFKIGDNGKISYYDDKYHVSGELLNAEEVGDACLVLDNVDRITDSHFSRVVFRRADEKQETGNISVATSYDLTVGVPRADGKGYEQVANAQDADLYRGKMSVKCTCTVIEHTERGKKMLYLVAYPQVIVIPADWQDHLFDPFEGM